jgi:hypothetical protein
MITPMADLGFLKGGCGLKLMPALGRKPAVGEKICFTPTLLHVSLAQYQKKKIVFDVKEFHRDKHRFYMVLLKIKGYYDL